MPTTMFDRRGSRTGEWLAVRQIADQAFCRASGAPLRLGNDVRVLRDAAENYPAWLDAIDRARRSVCFEMYIVHEDEQGRLFAEALLRKAAQGVDVRLIYDWLGAFGKTSRRFWNRLRGGGVDVRCYNPPRLDSPLGWVSRDHRKTLVVDSDVAFITGLCVGQAWAGDPARGLDPWRDTGVEIRGPAVADVMAAFAEAWAATGTPLPTAWPMPTPGEAGDMAVRVVASVPATGGLFRVDQLVAALARETLWLTDAYYAGTASYVQALRSAALDHVDVRLLVPGATDIPSVRLFSRAGYRPLLEAGIRVFEWNGSMMHAKTAVADGRWARVGSSNLNIASWMGNRELDVIVEDERFAKEMADMFTDDLANATEVVLEGNRVRAPGAPRRRGRRSSGSRTSSGGRVVAGAVRVGNTVAAAIASTRVLEAVEANVAVIAAACLGIVAALALAFPRVVSYTMGGVAIWVAIALLVRGVELVHWSRRARRQQKPD